MSNATYPEMRVYDCHKQVFAAKITGVEKANDASGAFDRCINAREHWYGRDNPSSPAAAGSQQGQQLAVAGSLGTKLDGRN